MKALSFFLSVFFIGFFFCQTLVFSQDNTIFQNKVLKEGIKTVLCYKKGQEMSFPLINLESEEQIIFSFDELGNSINDYSWTLIHCNSNWQQSDLETVEYIDGYPSGNIDNYKFSQNTMVNYINYWLELPNEESRLMISGNYLLKIYERNNPENLIITQRFYVAERLVKISAKVDQIQVNSGEGRNQRINVQFNCNQQIENPSETLKFKIFQNTGFEKDFAKLKPSFVNGNTLKFELINELGFAGGNEYRHFDLKSLKFISDRILDIEKKEDCYHIRLREDEDRSSLPYNFKNDLNGRKLIKLENNEKSRIMADYCVVYFDLNAEIPLQNGDFYIYGSISDWGYGTKTKMDYDFNKKKFFTKLFLKQGYYNYLYLFKTEDKFYKTEEGKLITEGNHFQTENEYQILVYYKDYTTSFEKLVGYALINSTISADY